MEGPHVQGPPTGQGPPSSLKLSGLPPLDCCILYGSSYYPQRPAGESGALQPREQHAAGNQGGPLKQRIQGSLGAPLKDMLLLVPQQRLLQWHTDNLTHHASHYGPLIRWVSAFGGPLKGASFAVRLTQSSGVSVLFNCRVPLDEAAPGNEGLCKYGVVPTEALIDDLRNWRHMYFAGRMQKPVTLSWSPGVEAREETEAALHKNRLNALRLALLLLPEEITFKRLLEEIVSLSYRGDLRMLIAEDPDKVSKIVRGQAAELCAIYQPLLEAIPSAHLELSEGPLLGAPKRGPQEGPAEGPHFSRERLGVLELLKEKRQKRMQSAEAAAVAEAIETGALRVRSYQRLQYKCLCICCQLSVVIGAIVAAADVSVFQDSQDVLLQQAAAASCCSKLLQQHSHDRSPAALSALYAPLPASFRSSSESCESPVSFQVSPRGDIITVPTLFFLPLFNHYFFLSCIYALHLLLLSKGSTVSPGAAAAGPVKRLFTFFTVKPPEKAPRDPYGGPHEGASKATLHPPATGNLMGGLQQLIFWPALKCSLKNAVAAGVSTSAKRTTNEDTPHHISSSNSSSTNIISSSSSSSSSSRVWLVRARLMLN
ncbi:hypothetical protein Emag_000609 [Eimeria magna]